MLVLTAGLAIFCLFVAPVQGTYVRVNYTLICNSPYSYRYKVILRELDVFDHDYLSDRVGEATGVYVGDIDGGDWGDPPTPSFEFAVVVEHNCGGGRMRAKMIELGNCWVSEKECIYGMIRFYL